MNGSQIKTLLVALCFLHVGPACIQSDRKIIRIAANRILAPQPIVDHESVSGLDPRSAEQWALTKIDMPTVWRTLPQTGTRRVTVALIGSGVDYNHEDLRNNIWVNPIESKIKNPGDSHPQDGIDDDENGYIDDCVGWDVINHQGLAFDTLGSGTAAAGIIGAVSNNSKGIRGINSKVSLIPIRYLNDDGRSHLPNLIEALKYALAVHPDVVFVHLANLNFAEGIQNKKTREEIQKAEESSLVESINAFKKRGTAVVISAGNRGIDANQSFSVLKRISKIENVLVVTSVNGEDQRPFIANYGMLVVGTAAPGEEVLTTLPNNQYGKVSGTFVAAAHVTGAIALAVSQHYGKMTYENYFQALLSAAGSDPLASMEFETGGGNRLNISKFLAALEK